MQSIQVLKPFSLISLIESIGIIESSNNKERNKEKENKKEENEKPRINKNNVWGELKRKDNYNDTISIDRDDARRWNPWDTNNQNTTWETKNLETNYSNKTYWT